jgi:hypothetical protein
MQERDKVIDEFRQGKAKVLISTNLLARGIDILQVSLVVNYDLPMKPDGKVRTRAFSPTAVLVLSFVTPGGPGDILAPYWPNGSLGAQRHRHQLCVRQEDARGRAVPRAILPEADQRDQGGGITGS